MTPTAGDDNPVLDTDSLNQYARWIRDDLEIQVARDGPNAMHSDDLLDLDEFLRSLLTANIDVSRIRHSRIHLAILDITGPATRWPRRIIDRSDALKIAWQDQFGPLKELGIPLYGVGGRLNGICTAEDINRADLVRKWMKLPEIINRQSLVKKRGHAGFQPGDWWINSTFAFHDGIIDEKSISGGITADSTAAYAVLLTGNNELEGGSFDRMTYCANSGRERYRLTSASPDSRLPIRILRNHNLRSFLAPQVGVRYDGLYRVTGWRICRNTSSRVQNFVYHVHFERLPHEISAEDVLKRPLREEIDEYLEYERQRQQVSTNVENNGRSGEDTHASSTNLDAHETRLDSADGAVDTSTQSAWPSFGVDASTLFRPINWRN